jgi:para-nitrobenzyl esterase
MISEGVENLFQRVIIQSAPLGFRLKRSKMSLEFFQKTAFLQDEKDPLKMTESYSAFLPSFMKYGLKTSMPFVHNMAILLYVQKKKAFRNGKKMQKNMMY